MLFVIIRQTSVVTWDGKRAPLLVRQFRVCFQGLFSCSCVVVELVFRPSFQRDFEVAAAVSRLAEAVAGRLDRLRRPARIALAAMARTFPSLAHLSRLFPEDKEEKKEEEKEDQEWWLVACSCLEEPGAVASGALAGLAAAAGLRAPDERPREALLRFVAARPELQRRLWCSLLPRLLGDVPDDEVSSGEIPEEVGKMGRLAGHSLALLDALLRNGCLESALSPSRAASLGCAVLRLVDEEVLMF